MTELDLEIPGLATELINEYGKNIAYTRIDSGDYDPATSSAGAGNGEPVNIKGILEPYKGQMFEGELVETDDLKLTCAGEAFALVPTSGDKVEFDGKTYNIVNVKPTYSGELVALYELQIRRG